VNRIPASGCIVRKQYFPGKFFVASLDKASGSNERMELLIQTNQGHMIGVIQIAGWIARRIVCYPEKGDVVIRGTRLGMIRFGSRVEIYLPEKATIQVYQGQSTKAGETIIGCVQ
jgi:phosphatidylserine decarboxylase